MDRPPEGKPDEAAQQCSSSTAAQACSGASVNETVRYGMQIPGNIMVREWPARILPCLACDRTTRDIDDVINKEEGYDRDLPLEWGYYSRIKGFNGLSPSGEM